MKLKCVTSTTLSIERRHNRSSNFIIDFLFFRVCLFDGTHFEPHNNNNNSEHNKQCANWARISAKETKNVKNENAQTLNLMSFVPKSKEPRDDDEDDDSKRDDVEEKEASVFFFANVKNNRRTLPIHKEWPNFCAKKLSRFSSFAIEWFHFAVASVLCSFNFCWKWFRNECPANEYFPMKRK